jgi:hypothetical protein
MNRGVPVLAICPAVLATPDATFIVLDSQVSVHPRGRMRPKCAVKALVDVEDVKNTAEQMHVVLQRLAVPHACSIPANSCWVKGAGLDLGGPQGGQDGQI